MPRGKEISDDLREAIVLAHQSGKGYKTISKELGVQRSTVRMIIHKWKVFKTVDNLPRSGRPSKFTPMLDFAMLREMQTNPRATSQSLRASLNMLNVKVHDSTIRKRLTKYAFCPLSNVWSFKDISSAGSSDDVPLSMLMTNQNNTTKEAHVSQGSENKKQGLLSESSDDEPLINLVKKTQPDNQTKAKSRISTKKKNTSFKKSRKTSVTDDDRLIKLAHHVEEKKILKIMLERCDVKETKVAEVPTKVPEILANSSDKE